MADEAGATGASGGETAAAGGSPGQDRRAALDARFKASAEERQASKQARLAAAEDATDPAESAARFWAQFNSKADALHAEVCSSVGAGRSMGDAEKRAVMPPRVEAWLSTLAALQQSSAQASLFLAKYDVRQAEARLGMLRDEVDEARAKLVPRKKFAFRRKQRQPQQADATTASGGIDSAAASADGSGGDSEAKAVDSCAKFEVAMKSFEGRRGETLIVRPGELCGSDASASVDFRLTNLEDCTVLLLDVTRALHVDKLTRCHVVTGPVAGSVLMEACTDCTFVFASRQIRLHTSHRCDFYLHVLSRPIIEHCDALRFACYNVGYTALAAQLAAAELDKPRAASMWRCVDDFGWHRTQHSPNWSLVPPADYRTVWPDAVAADVVTELGAILSVPAAATEAGAGDAAGAAGTNAGASIAPPADTAAVAPTTAADDESDSDAEL